MEIKLVVLGPLKLPSGSREELIECPTSVNVMEFFRIAEQKFGLELRKLVFQEGSGEIRRSIAICLNRKGLIGSRRIEFFDGLETELNAHDELIVFMPVCGG